MTYCAALRVKAGLVLASDSRTNAGMDNISTFSKMSIWNEPGDRWIGMARSGHLGVTQAVDRALAQGFSSGAPNSLKSAKAMWQAAEACSEALRQENANHGHLCGGIDKDASFLIAGQIAQEETKLFMVNPQGNFIEASDGTMFFQLGEMKYGKPMLDRASSLDMSLEDAAKCVLVSFDAALRSNLSVGCPIDLAV